VGQHDAQLEWERRFGRLAAAAAIASLVLGLAAQVLSATIASTQEGQRAGLLKLDENADQALAAAILQALSVIFLAAVLFYLLRCARYRRGEAITPAVGPLVLLGPLLYAVGGIITQLDVIDIADRFAASGERTERRADDLLEARSTVPVFIGFAGNIALGFALVMINLNAMRTGLMTRFIGILGIIVGALYVLPLFAGPLIIQIFWLGALAAIFLGRWPGGRGEAWETGEAGQWLSAAELRRQALREERLDEEPEPVPEPESEPEPEPEAAPHPVSKKRRKRRR
jgi:hypothetical protein